MPYINSIATANPSYQYSQDDLAKFMYCKHQGIDPRKIDLIYAKSSIHKRYSVLPDFQGEGFDAILFKNNNNPNIQQRLHIFKKEAANLGKSACDRVLNQENTPTHIITVTCTGLSAPGLDFELIQLLHLPSDIQRYSVNFMGCFAAFHAIKLAHALCKADAGAKVLIVCIELCTIHLHKGDDLESVVSNALFADGAAACMVSNDPYGLEIESFMQDIIPESEKEMSWDVTPHYFSMRLSGLVPSLLEAHISKFRKKIFNTPIEFHAVHPGGKKILEAYQHGAGLIEADLEYSYNILKDYGNMSSATILFVLKNIMQSKKLGKVFASGFGPGLTMEGMLLEKV